MLWVDPPISCLTPLQRRPAAVALREHAAATGRAEHHAAQPRDGARRDAPGAARHRGRQARRAVRRAVGTLGVPGCTARSSPRSTTCSTSSRRPARLLRHRRLRRRGGADGHRPALAASGSSARSSAKADVVIAVSPVLRDKWSPSARTSTWSRTAAWPPSSRDADARAAPADVTLPAPIAGFIGHMSDRIDLEMLEAVADTGARCCWSGRARRRSRSPSSTRCWRGRTCSGSGPSPFEELPSYLRAIDVGLTPYHQTAFNRASFPLKTLEYLAAGRPAVVTDLPAHRWLDTPHVDIVRHARGVRARGRTARSPRRGGRRTPPRGARSAPGTRGRRARRRSSRCSGSTRQHGRRGRHDDAGPARRRRRRLRARDRRGGPRHQRGQRPRGGCAACSTTTRAATARWSGACR